METTSRPLFTSKDIVFGIIFLCLCLSSFDLSNASDIVHFQHDNSIEESQNIQSPLKLTSSLLRKRRDVTDYESQGDDSTCQNQQQFFDTARQKLKNGEKLETTHTFSNETKFNLALAWAGKNDDGVMLVLTTEHGIFTSISSTLWRSTNNGRTWEDWNHSVDNKTFRQDDGLQRNPHNPKKVYLVSYQHFLYKSDDGGATWSQKDLVMDEELRKIVAIDEQLEFHPEKEFENYVLVVSNERKLYVTYDNFATNLGDHIKENVHVVKWGTKEQKGNKAKNIFALIGESGGNPFFKTGPTLYDLERYDSSTKTWANVLKRVSTFDVQMQFMYASIYKSDHPKTLEDEKRMMISSDGGSTWDEAQLPTLTGDRFYSVLDMSEGLIFMHVDNPGDTGHGVLYTSSEDGLVYSESLKNHLFPNYNTVHDFYKVQSIKGVYLASQMDDDKSIHSVITYDLGGEWKKINRPMGAKCENDAKEGCWLQIHNAYSIHRGIKAKMPTSLEKAYGLVLVHGHVAANLQTTNPDVFLSTDGGYNFKKVLTGPHAYEIADSGGLILAVALDDVYAKVIKFSTDEGHCWHTYKFTSDDIKFTGLLTEPGGRSLTVSIWGYTKDTKKWTVNVINFGEVIDKQCTDKDYEPWIPHSGMSLKPSKTDGCLLGTKWTFYKIKQDSWCQNGYNKHMASSSENCECGSADYLCDFGFYRKDGSETCVRQPEIHSDTIEICKGADLERLITVGYRKVPGNKCTGGFQPKETQVSLGDVCARNEKMAVVQDMVEPPKKGGTNAALIVVLLIVLVVLVLGVGVFFGHKFIILRRHKVTYRYSMLGQNENNSDEAENLMDPVDALFVDSDEELEEVEQENRSPQKQPTRTQQPDLKGYHDDSDDDMLG